MKSFGLTLVCFFEASWKYCLSELRRSLFYLTLFLLRSILLSRLWSLTVWGDYNHRLQPFRILTHLSRFRSRPGLQLERVTSSSCPGLS